MVSEKNNNWDVNHEKEIRQMKGDKEERERLIDGDRKLSDRRGKERTWGEV